MKIEKNPNPEQGWWLSWYQDPPETTRDRILFCAFKEVHLNGFQSASIQNIINAAGVTKGALYHYFDSKDAIGLALLDEIFTKYVETNYIAPISNTNDPITTFIEFLQASGSKMTEEDVALGCPMDHFSQEMAPINQQFQKRIDRLYQKKSDALVSAFKRGQVAGNVTREVPAESIALMVTATLQGCMGIAKNTRSLDSLMQCGEGLIHYLESLRPV